MAVTSNNKKALVDASSTEEISRTWKENGKKQGNSEGFHPSKKTATAVDSDSSTCAESSSSSSSSDSSTSECFSPRRTKRRSRPSSKRKPKNGKRSNGKANKIMTFEEQSQYVSMDCEMVGVGLNGQSSAVARVTIINWNGKMLFDEYIRPSREVTDYRTFVSGITPQHVKKAQLDIEECRSQVLNILQDKILVGHALKNDLQALNITHPWYQTRDTAKYEPFMKVRFDDGILWPRKLKELVQEKLNRKIQIPGQPHSAYEDALAALDLYRLVRGKWEKAMEYKINKTKEIQQRQLKEKQQQ